MPDFSTMSQARPDFLAGIRFPQVDRVVISSDGEKL
jgi:hypothetical protein